MPGCTSRIPTGLTCRFPRGEARDDVGATVVVALLPANRTRSGHDALLPIRSRPRGAQTGATTTVAPTAAMLDDVALARARRGSSAVVVALRATVVPVARPSVDRDAAQSVTCRVAEHILRLAADLACGGRRHCAIVATDGHINLVPVRVGRNRVRAGGRCGVRVRAWRRSGILNSEHGRARPSKEVMIVAGIVPDFVGPALARHDLDGAAIAIVHD